MIGGGGVVAKTLIPGLGSLYTSKNLLPPLVESLLCVHHDKDWPICCRPAAQLTKNSSTLITGLVAAYWGAILEGMVMIGSAGFVPVRLCFQPACPAYCTVSNFVNTELPSPCLTFYRRNIVLGSTTQHPRPGTAIVRTHRTTWEETKGG